MYSIEWIGHSCFLVKTPDANIIVDPFLDSNPNTRKTVENIGSVDLILLTHGHFDHTTEAVPLALKTGAPIVCAPELAHLLKMLDPSISCISMGVGGTLSPSNLWEWETIPSIQMTSALHSSSFQLGETRYYAGLASGYLLTLQDGSKTVRLYHAGDTALHMDMKLLENNVDIALLPIDGHYNMSWESALVFDRWISPPCIIPMHYNTFPEIQISEELLEKIGHHKKVKILDNHQPNLSLLAYET